jgi:CO/xanthine dehydrogenase Mo-binding subunit
MTGIKAVPVRRASELTREARSALSRAGFSRRSFLKGSGVLIVGFSVARVAGQLGIAPGASAQQQAGAEDPRGQLDAWIAITADGTVVAYTGKCELGQGLFTAQTQLIAEELNVSLARVKLIQCDTAVTPDQGTTSGSESHPTNFNQGALALAAATARQALLQLAAKRLAVAEEQLTIRDGVVSVTVDRTRAVSYGDLVGGRKFEIPLSRSASRKPMSQWTVLGSSVPRVDIPGLVTARAEFVQNVKVPGMLHGRVVRPPAVGASVASIDESSVKGIPGLVKVVVKKDFVGVVAEKPWQAVQAANRLKVSWSKGTGLPVHRDYYEYLRKQRGSRDTFIVNSGDVDAKLASAARIVQATYLHPYQMHASIGSSCAVADVQSGGATIWAASQNVWALKRSTAMVLGMNADTVRLIFTRGSGCYGINSSDTVTFDAAILSQAVGRPVKVQLSRKDEMAWENYGLPYVIDQRAGLDAQGNIIAWDYQSWSAARGGRPGVGNPGNVVTGLLAGFQPVVAAARTPAPMPMGQLDVNDNAASQYVAGRVEGKAHGTGTIASERVLMHRLESPFFTGPLRAPARLQNTFANESFIDECAAAAKADPLAYRLRHLHDQRLIDVINAAVKAAKWESRPSPKPGIRRTGLATGRGLASVVCEGDNGWVAVVADVQVDQATGRVVVKRLVMAGDCGPISNPDGVKNQLEGGALHGVSRALSEEVAWDAEKITTVDWRSYVGLTLGSELPEIEVVLLNRTDVPAAGAGESSITVIAAAIANAIFDATGVRLRQVPFTPERVKAALAVTPSGSSALPS